MTGSAWTANGTNVDASREEASFEPLPGLSDPYASSTRRGGQRGLLQAGVRAELLVPRDASDPGSSGIARINLSTTAPVADPWQRWLASKPGLTGPNALETADPDKDGYSNLLELAFGGDPLANTAPPISQSLTPQGFQVEALVDRGALAGLTGVAPIDVSWEVSYDLKIWYPGPVATIVGTQGPLTRERIVLPWNGPRFARLAVRLKH